MFELWAKRRKTLKYEYLTSFMNENQKYYMMDQLDRNIYKEAMITNNEECILYCEFEKPLIKILQKK